MLPQENINRVLAKLRRLPPGCVGEVEDFIDFINQRIGERELTRAAPGDDGADTPGCLE